MPNTYTQMYVHVVFAVRQRAPLISRAWKERLHQYITGIIQNQGHKLIAVNTMPDHIHIFIGLKPDAAVSDLIRDVKRDSTNFVNHKVGVRAKFAWQEGFGAFTHSHSEIDAVVKYILNQENHHRRKAFREEYEALLKEFAIVYDKRYLPEQITP